VEEGKIPPQESPSSDRQGLAEWILPMAQQLLCKAARLMGSRCRIVRGAIASLPLGAMAVFIAPVVHAEPLQPASPPPIEAPQPARTMNMTEALAYAREHQPSMHVALSEVAARMAEAKIPTGQWLPTAGVTAQLFGMTANNTTATYVNQEFMDIPRIGATPARASGSLSPYASTFVGAGILQEAFDFGRIGAQRAAADALVAVEKHRAARTLLDIDFATEEAYFSVLAAKAIVRASDDAYERARVHRDFAKRGVDSGLRSPIDLTRAEADLARFDVGRVRARGGVAVAQSVLAAAIGAPDPAVDTSAEAPKLPEMPSLGRALDLAQARDPRLAEAIASLRAAEERTRAVGAELRPDLSLTGTFSGRAGGAPPSSGPTPNGDGWIPGVPNWDAGLILAWPLFDGTIAARHEAARSHERVRHDEIDVAREKEVADVRQTYLRVEVTRSALVALENAVIASRANYDQADARFRAGIGNAVELADAETVRTEAEIEAALGQFELARARAAFGRSIAEAL
jgi:outer membrane protein